MQYPSFEDPINYIGSIWISLGVIKLHACLLCHPKLQTITKRPIRIVPKDTKLILTHIELWQRRLQQALHMHHPRRQKIKLAYYTSSNPWKAYACVMLCSKRFNSIQHSAYAKSPIFVSSIETRIYFNDKAEMCDRPLHKTTARRNASKLSKIKKCPKSW